MNYRGYRIGTLIIGLWLFHAINSFGQKDLEYWEVAWIRDSSSKNWEGIHIVSQKIRSLAIGDRVKTAYYKRALKFYESIGLNVDTLYGRTYLLLGLDSYQQDCSEAIGHLKTSLRYYRKVYSPDHHRIHAAYFHIAEKSLIDQQIDQARLYCDSAISLQWQGIKGDNWPRTLNLMARIYGYLGDLGKSRLCLLIAQPYADKLEVEDPHYFANTQAGIFRDLNLPDEALKILQPILKRPNAPFYSYSQAGQAFLDLGQPDSAIYFFQKQLALSSGHSASEIAWIHDNISRCYQQMGDYERAIHHFQKIDFKDIGQDQKTLIFSHLAKTLMLMGSMDSSLIIHRSLKNAFLKSDQLTIFDQAGFYSSYLELLFRLWKWRNDSNFIMEASGFIHETDSVLKVLRYSLTSPSGRQNFAGFYRSFYDTAIKIAFELYNLYGDDQYADQALQYMESTKALVLAEEFAEKRSEESTKLKYRLKYQDLEEKLHRAVNPDVRISISDSIFYWFQKEGNEGFADNQVFSFSVPEFDDFKREKATLYINYFQHQDSSLSVVSIGNQQSYFNYIPGAEWYQLVKSKLELIRVYSYENQAQQKTDQLLMGSLFPIATRDFPSRLVIVPDGILSYFPFEVLRTEKALPLIKYVDISYSFSLAMRDQVMQYPAIEGTALIMAPEFAGDVHVTSRSVVDRDIRLSALQFNRQEARSILEYLKDGQLFLDDAATASNFLAYCEKSPVIHIATHAIASQEDEQRTQILFSEAETPNSIYLADIYNHKIPANMVVMSACQTAIGRYAGGEGVMSFARAFTAAGSKSVIASLWAVNDQSTQEIMVYFYKYLQRGWKKDVALRKAKLEYIDRINPEYNHPYFWGGFIAIGDMSPIVSNWQIYPVLLILIIALIAAVSVFYYLRMKRRKPSKISCRKFLIIYL